MGLSYLPASILWFFGGAKIIHNDNSVIYQNILHTTQGSADSVHVGTTEDAGNSGNVQNPGLTATQLQELVRKAVNDEMFAWAAAHKTDDKKVPIY